MLGGEKGRTQAYSWIKTYMVKKQFEHRQGSAYMSDRPLSDAEIYDLTDELVRRHPWLTQCVNGYDVTNVGATHDYLFVFAQYGKESEDVSEDDILI
jgi:virulence-associated protein VapD